MKDPGIETILGGNAIMNTLTKILLTAAAAAAIITGVAMGDTIVHRIDHPNGPPTFVAVPERDRAPSIAVYSEGYIIEDQPLTLVLEEAPGNTDSLGRTLIPIHRGRGEVFYVPIER